MKPVYYILIFVFLTGCTSKTIYPKPKDLIPKDTMGMLLKDLFLANAARSIKNINLQRKVNYHSLVYNKYKIDSARFESSNFYYISRIDDYEDVLAKIILDIEKEQKFLVAEKRLKDSLRRDSIQTMKAKKKKLLNKKTRVVKSLE